LPRKKTLHPVHRFAVHALDRALGNGTLARWSHGWGLHGKLSVTSYEFSVPEPVQLERPLRVAFASDFHAGPSTHPGMFEELVDELIRLAPDLLLLGGDFVTCKGSQIDELLPILQRFTPALGQYAVLGNHDRLADASYIQRELESAGVRVLINAAAHLPAPFEGVSVCGIDDPWTGEPNPTQAFEGAGPLRIFLTHSPEGLMFVKSEQFHVGLAGHTHGGQIALPGGRAIITGGGPLSRRYPRGYFAISGNGPLIVGRGIGCGGIPLRLNADPELIICTFTH
jgi:predicted MPP superfamily phosphohydrolase